MTRIADRKDMGSLLLINDKLRRRFLFQPITTGNAKRDTAQRFLLTRKRRIFRCVPNSTQAGLRVTFVHSRSGPFIVPLRSLNFDLPNGQLTNLMSEAFLRSAPIAPGSS